MPLGTGLDAQVGLAKESGHGTYTAPTHFLEFNSASIEPTVTKLYSMALGSGRLQRTSRRRTYVTGGSGTLEIDAVNRGIGLLLELMFGSVVTAQVSTTDEYTHTFTPDEDGKRGLSATVQVGVPTTEASDNVKAFSYVGGKITGWELSAQLDEILKISTTWDFKSVTTAETLGTPSYAVDPEVFTFLDGSLTIDGDAVGTVKGFTLTWEEAMDTERRYFGNEKGEPLANGELVITGQLDHEFTSIDAYNDWVAGAEVVDMVVTFALGDIPDGDDVFKLVITVPSLEYTGTAPTVTGPEVVQQNLPFKALWNGADEIITAVLHTDDITP